MYEFISVSVHKTGTNIFFRSVSGLMMFIFLDHAIRTGLKQTHDNNIVT